MRYHPASELRAHGVELPAPESVHVGREVDLSRVARRGVVLHPQVRIEGARTLLSEGVEIGTEGPVVLKDCALGAGARVASGSAERAVLLAGASLGPASHVRAGTLLEEGASTGHAVGLKQTVVLAFGTIGSNVNFCDCLLAGGRSRADHSEVGSGFIHFNFTPFGRKGDKATASLFGDVVRGVLMREDRVFLGGAGGVVGPIEVGFGTVLGAGSVYRRSHPDGRLVYAETLPARSVEFDPGVVRGAERRFAATRRYLGQLVALRAWYDTARRLGMSGEAEEALLEAALATLDAGVAERLAQGDRLAENLEFALAERAAAYGGEAAAREGAALAGWREFRAAFAPSAAAPPAWFAEAFTAPGSHLERVAALDATRAAEARTWLAALAAV
ncbi:MAG: UDP-N-acetylglucosamine pyrophosphorylase [Planctomycetota bacterium]